MSGVKPILLKALKSALLLSVHSDSLWFWRDLNPATGFCFLGI